MSDTGQSSSEVRSGDLPVAPEEPEEKGWWKRQREKRWFRWGVDIAVVLTVVFLASMWQSRHLLERSAELPPMILTDLTGETIDLADLEARRTVIYAWATWCGVCDLQKGAISSLHGGAGDDLEVISVVFDSGDRETVQRFADENGLDFPVYMGTPQLARALEVNSFPTIYIVDQESRIRHGLVGYKTGLGLRLRLLF